MEDSGSGMNESVVVGVNLGIGKWLHGGVNKVERNCTTVEIILNSILSEA